MMYPYITLPDKTEIVHSQLIDDNGTEKVVVHFERPKSGSFDSARCELPSYIWTERDGFTDDEMKFFDEFLVNNAHLIFKYAKAGGIKIA